MNKLKAICIQVRQWGPGADIEGFQGPMEWNPLSSTEETLNPLGQRVPWTCWNWKLEPSVAQEKKGKIPKLNWCWETQESSGTLFRGFQKQPEGSKIFHEPMEPSLYLFLYIPSEAAHLYKLLFRSKFKKKWYKIEIRVMNVKLINRH